MKRVELRTSFVRWYFNLLNHVQKQISDLMKSRQPDMEKLAALRVQADECREEIRRYSLQARVCGNEVLIVR